MSPGTRAALLSNGSTRPSRWFGVFDDAAGPDCTYLGADPERVRRRAMTM
jgi:hypothetical protein